MHLFGDPGRCGWDTRAPCDLGDTSSTLLPERRPPARPDAKFIWHAPDRRSALRQRRWYPGQCADAHLVTRSAFSLVEIIIAVGLLSVIMLGLLMMFNQTQRAFRTSLTQVDVLESGRAAVGLISHELEQMTPFYGTNANFFTAILPKVLLTQPLPGTTLPRTNFLEDVFFLSKENQTWTGIGYFARIEDSNGKLQWPTTTIGGTTLGAARLYRYEKRILVGGNERPTQLFTNFLDQSKIDRTPGTNCSRLVDGMVHFKIRAFDTNGVWMRFSTNANMLFNTAGTSDPGEPRDCYFLSNAVPASVEFELGLLEDRTYERYKSLPDNLVPLANDPRYRYLTNQAGRVHIFRQRVQIRNVDPAAYQ